jgi:HPt (histidine-containing phosphotransfer) domain-containing protein
MIDWDRVNELRDEVGAEDFAEVVQMFLEEVEEVMVRLIAAPDQKLYEEDLHFLKGSALSLGFEHFSALCQSGETASANERAGTVDLEEIFESYAASKAEFMAQQEQLAA